MAYHAAMNVRSLTQAIAASILLLSITPVYADFTGKVVAVKDGDTIEVLRDRTPVTIRLNGIDCPEKSQAFGQKAKAFTSDLVFGKVVTVREKDKDRYGRTIGEVILEDGRSLNRELVAAGLAWWYRQYAPKDTVLEELETKARGTKAGLWADKAPVPPWDYRKASREKRAPVADDVQPAYGVDIPAHSSTVNRY